MKWSIIAVGKPKLRYARAGIEDYLARIGRVAAVEFVAVKASSAKLEGIELLARSEGAHRIVLDERGRTLSSVGFADYVGERRDRGVRWFALLVGGADGHVEETRNAGDVVLALSQLTLQHELATLVAAEQIYRAHTILAGGPYHRE